MLLNKYNLKAFTLIELLVVISIIALLVSILLPSLNTARGLAKTVMCSSNLKNVGLAHAMYMQENEDKIIVGQQALPAGQTSSKYCYWYGLLRPYMGLTMNGAENTPPGLLVCPSDLNYGGKVYFKVTYDFWSMRSFAANVNLYSPSPVKTVGSLPQPNQTIFIAESDWWDYANTNFVRSDTEKSLQTVDTERHNGDANILHVGGSAERVKSETLLSDGDNFSYWSINK